MKEYIAKKDAIKLLNEQLVAPMIEHPSHNRAIHRCVEIIKKMIPAPDVREVKWKPYDAKHEPEKGKMYLVTVNFDGHIYVDIDEYIDSGWDDYINGEVLAWMPLPEVYSK